MWIAADASAQSSACDQLKGTLSARIEASGVRDYALEAVPAATPTPGNARVIGTCDGGRTKMLYRRGAAALPMPAEPNAAQPAPALPASAASGSRAVRAPKIDVVAEDRAPAPVQAPIPAPAPVLTPATTPAPQPASPPSETAALAPPAQPEKDSVPTPSLPTASLVQQATDVAAGYWKWLLALVLVPMAGWLWAWVAYRRAYDKSGLPRGPRL